MAKNFPSTSFMNLFKNIVYDKTTNPNAILDIWDAYVISPFYSDNLSYFQLHKVSEGQTWVSLSLLYYNDPSLWWLIPLFNNIDNPFIVMDQTIFLNEITQLKILKPEYVGQLLLQARQIKIINDRQFESDQSQGLTNDT